jgi:glucosamine--fructose-6-phosphate aminotransferase (isomerizing)
MLGLGEHTIREIVSQPVAWQAALDETQRRAGDLRRLLAVYAQQPLVLLGSGSPQHLAVAVAALTREFAGRNCIAAASADMVFNPRTVTPQDGPILAIIFSRSGETSEAIAAAQGIQSGGGAVIAVGCDAESRLLRMANVAVAVTAGQEDGAAQTRSFASMYVAGQAIVALMGQQQPADCADDGFEAALLQLPDRGIKSITQVHATIGSLANGAAIERIYVLGSGIRYGIACEAALKFQEMSLTDTNAYNVLEFRHGPMSMADEHALVIGLIGERGHKEELAVLSEAKAFGARVIAIAEQLSPEMSNLNEGFALESGLPEHARTVLYLPPLQLMAYERAIAKRLNPDAPRNVTKFVRIAELERVGS